MKIHKPIVGLAAMLVCLGIMALIKSVVYNPVMEERGFLEDQIEANNMVIQSLGGYAGLDAEALTATTEKIKALEENWINGFPGLYKDEDVILYVKDTEDDRGINITSLQLGQNTTVSSLGAGYSLSVKPVIFEYQETYQGFKNYVRYLTSKYPQTSLNNLTMVYDESQREVSGAFDLYLYYVEKAEYVKPEVNQDQGISNIFEAEGRLSE